LEQVEVEVFELDRCLQIGSFHLEINLDVVRKFDYFEESKLKLELQILECSYFKLEITAQECKLCFNLIMNMHQQLFFHQQKVVLDTRFIDSPEFQDLLFNQKLGSLDVTDLHSSDNFPWQFFNPFRNHFQKLSLRDCLEDGNFLALNLVFLNLIFLPFYSLTLFQFRQKAFWLHSHRTLIFGRL